MAATERPVSSSGNIVEGMLALVDGGGKPQAFTSASARFALTVPDAPGSLFVGLYATQDCYVRFGDVTVVAATAAAAHDVFIPSGHYREYPVPRSRPYIAVIRSSADGTLHICQLGGPVS